MNFEELAEARFSVRKFSSEPVSKEKLDLVLRAARLAPTAGNRQPQRIIAVTQPELINELDCCTPYLFDAPVVLIVCYDNQVCWKRPHDGQDSGVVDASIVTTHMMLQAADLGLGTTWVMYFDPQKLSAVCHLPENIVPVAMLVLGNPAPNAGPATKHSQREPMQTLVGFNKLPD